jgi:2-succinyl-5-enolpyruvyl-6-hydroxy-3-cyclohexene-1-carboxylate synthase
MSALALDPSVGGYADPADINPNTPWCRTIVAELLKLNVRTVVACAGSRSAAMLAAFREHDEFRIFIQTDERSGGYFALGMARAMRGPAAVCVTSGSAVANLVPALTEAYATGTPLVILSCDRPRLKRGLGLPQTTQQLAFCAPLVVASLDLPDPSVASEHLAQLASDLIALAPYLTAGPKQGPVQINIPLSGAMSSVDGNHGWDGRRIPRNTTTEPAPQIVSPNAGGNISDLEQSLSALELRPGMKGLIIGCSGSNLYSSFVRTLADGTRFPLLADAPSSFRGLGIPGVIAEGDILAHRKDIKSLRPDLVIRIGTAPISNALQEYVGSLDSKVLRIDARAVQADFLNSSVVQMSGPDEAAIRWLVRQLAPGDEAWKDLWLGTAAVCRRRLDLAIQTMRWNEVQAVAAALDCDFDVAHAGNSTAVRLVNLLMTTSANGRDVFVNRGVNGIDGTLGTFFGELAAYNRSGLLLIGDLSTIHDLPALETCRHYKYRGAIVILNNGGAGLFDHSPLSTLPDYASIYRNSVELDFSGIAQAFAIKYIRCGDVEGLRSALSIAESADELFIIDAKFPPKSKSESYESLVRFAAGGDPR